MSKQTNKQAAKKSKKKSKKRNNSHQSKQKKGKKDDCVKQTSKRYHQRPSPAYKANDCRGQTKRGNDGRLYESRKFSRGYRWYLKKSPPKSRRKSRKSAHPVRTLLECIPKQFDDLVHECQCQKRWKRKLKMGSGANGAAYHACNVRNSADCNYVIKVQPFNALAKTELDAYIRLKNSHLTPTLHAAWVCNKKMYLVLDRMFLCDPTPRRGTVLTLLKKWEKLGWLHVDTHGGNVMCTSKGKVVLIDYGWAVHKSDAPYPQHPACDRHDSDKNSFAWLKKVQTSNVFYSFHA